MREIQVEWKNAGRWGNDENKIARKQDNWKYLKSEKKMSEVTT